MTDGWKCPGCGKCYAPWVYSCESCGKNMVVTTPTTTYIKTGDPLPPPYTTTGELK